MKGIYIDREIQSFNLKNIYKVCLSKKKSPIHSRPIPCMYVGFRIIENMNWLVFICECMCSCLIIRFVNSGASPAISYSLFPPLLVRFTELIVVQTYSWLVKSLPAKTIDRAMIMGFPVRDKKVFQSFALLEKNFDPISQNLVDSFWCWISCVGHHRPDVLIFKENVLFFPQL